MANIHANLGLECNDILLREDMRNNLALSGVFVTIPDVEEPPMERHECVVEISFESSGSVAIDRVQGISRCNRNVVGGDANKWSYSRIKIMYNVGAKCWAYRISSDIR